MEKPGLSVRRVAHQMLQETTQNGQLLSEIIGGAALDGLKPDEKARAQRLVTQTLRGLDRLDRLLKPYFSKKPPPFVQNALRMASYEIVEDGAAHAIVDAYVELVGRNKRTQSMKGLVNAVLRKVAKDGAERWSTLPAPVTPRWLRQPLIAAWGNSAVARMEGAHFKGAPLDISAKTDPQRVAEATGGQLLESGSVRLSEIGQVTKLPGYDTGDWWVQDAAAAMPVKLLGAIAGKRVIDMCAAPGGKTLQLAAGGAKVVALDLSERRLERVTENLARTELTAEVIVGDALTYEDDPFDVVLLDAPCSATGTIRRHPDLPHAKDGSEFSALIAQQAAMIDHALTLLKPGGTLLYCTCSLLPDEGEVQVEEALVRHPELSVNRDVLNRDWIASEWVTEEGGVRLRPDYWPDLGGMDGFYIASLTKPA